MDELSEEIRQAYEAAQASELLARTHPEHLDHALRAAEQFERAAILSQRQAEDEEYDEEFRHVALVLAEYYFAQMHKSRRCHAYERRDCRAALAELKLEKQRFERAVRDAEGLMPALSEEGKAFLGPQLQSWKVSVAGFPSAEFGCRARQAWDEGNTVAAIDWYRHSVVFAENVLELEKQVPPTVNPASRRVMRGNMYSTIANASQAAAKILLDQAEKDKRNLYNFSRDEGIQLLGHFLDAHQAGTSAMTENPEWEQIGMATQACRKNIEEFLRDTKEYWALIYSRYQGNSTLEMLMRHMDPGRYTMAKSGEDASERAARSDSRSESGRATSVIKVLLLSANPVDAPLRIDEEFRAIDKKIRESDYRDYVQLIPHGAVRLEDIPSLLMRHMPHVVHFSGHSNASSIVLTGADGTGRFVPPDTLADIFRALKDNVRVVLLNACESAPQAAAIVSEIDCAVGMNDKIKDDAAIAFAAAFYEALGYGRSVQTAFDLALVQLAGTGADRTLAKLHRKRGVKPSDIILVNPPRPQ